MVGSGQRFPVTYSNSVEPRWDELLLQQMGLSAGSADLVCPIAVDEYGDVSALAGVTSYGINVRWEPGSLPGSNEGESWAGLRSPSTYPLFSDTDAYDAVYPPVIFDEIGVGPGPDWRMGFFHAKDASNVSFADGHVASIGREVLTGRTDDNDVPLFFFNRGIGGGIAAAPLEPNPAGVRAPVRGTP